MSARNRRPGATKHADTHSHARNCSRPESPGERGPLPGHKRESARFSMLPPWQLAACILQGTASAFVSGPTRARTHLRLDVACAIGPDCLVLVESPAALLKTPHAGIPSTFPATGNRVTRWFDSKYLLYSLYSRTNQSSSDEDHQRRHRPPSTGVGAHGRTQEQRRPRKRVPGFVIIRSEMWAPGSRWQAAGSD